MDKDILEKKIIELIDLFNIKKKVGYRAAILKLAENDEDKDIKYFLGDVVALTMKFKEEEEKDGN